MQVPSPPHRTPDLAPDQTPQPRAPSRAGPPLTIRAPQVKPALRRIWRDGGTLQLGCDPARAVLISGLDPRQVELLDRLDGTADPAALRREATRLGLAPELVDDLLHLLAGSGVLEDAAELADASGWLARLEPAERDRLAPDAAAASLARTRTAAAALAARRRTVVQVLGAGRVGASLAALLAAAGVGTVVVEDAAATRPADLAPGGLTPADVGARRQDAVARLLRRGSPSVRTSPRARTPHLVVLARDSGLPDPRVGERLVRAGQPHLHAGVLDTTGVVGPLVLPGRSSCLRCHDLHRADRDPAWPEVAAQLADGRGRGPLACDVVLATAVAAHAGLQVLQLVDDGSATPLTVDGTLEIARQDGRVRRRSWSPHPSCGCTWWTGGPDRARPPTAV